MSLVFNFLGLIHRPHRHIQLERHQSQPREIHQLKPSGIRQTPSPLPSSQHNSIKLQRFTVWKSSPQINSKYTICNKTYNIISFVNIATTSRTTDLQPVRNHSHYFTQYCTSVNGFYNLASTSCFRFLSCTATINWYIHSVSLNIHFF